MNKVKCPKCRRILFRFKSELATTEGELIIHVECPDCRALTEIKIGPYCEDGVKKLKDESELEIQE